jgi:hypothetical protein
MVGQMALFYQNGAAPSAIVDTIPPGRIHRFMSLDFCSEAVCYGKSGEKCGVLGTMRFASYSYHASHRVIAK